MWLHRVKHVAIKCISTIHFRILDLSWISWRHYNNLPFCGAEIGSITSWLQLREPFTDAIVISDETNQQQIGAYVPFEMQCLTGITGTGLWIYDIIDSSWGPFERDTEPLVHYTASPFIEWAVMWRGQCAGWRICKHQLPCVNHLVIFIVY